MRQKKIILVWISIFCLSLLWGLVKADACTTLNWSIIVADDWTYLWTLSSNSFSKDSISNEFGTYGSQFNSKSIFNEFGTYGSQFNSKSPWNEFSSKGPLIIKSKKTLWRLTLNKFADGYLNTFSVLLCFISSDDDRLEPFLDLIDDGSSSTYTPVVSTYIPIQKTQLQICQEYFWLNSTTPENSQEKIWNDWINWVKANSCVCKDWYARESWTCVVKTTDNSCFDSIAYYLDSDWTCKCNAWYKMDSNGIFCNIDTEDKSITATQNCQNQFWINSYSSWWINKNGWYSCYCNVWYTRNDTITSCIKWVNSEKTAANLELQNAIMWMYDNWLTSLNTISTFMWEEYLTREQASKFFVQFGKKILGKKVDSKKVVKLNDLKKADNTLQSYIKEANQLWLFKWVQGNFLPFNKLTRAQAIAVIIRANNGVQDETQNQWYKKYYDIVNNYWILERLGFNIDTLDSSNIKRKEIALLLYRLYNYIEREDSSIKLCQNEYWEFSNSEWIVNSSWTYDCTCKEWYGRNKNQTKCIEATDKNSCQDIYWKYSYTDWTLGDKWEYNCFCQEWYVINESLGKCIPVNEDCQQIFWKYSYRDQTIAKDFEWKYDCKCQEWYDWESEDEDAPCVKK